MWVLVSNLRDFQWITKRAIALRERHNAVLASKTGIEQLWNKVCNL